MRAGGFDSPEATEAAFYAAFEQADVEAMMAVWAERRPVECIHPRGPRLQGADAVRRSWTHIFRGGPSGLRFDVTEVRRIRDGDLVVHVVHERITVPGEPGTRPPVIATNVYCREDEGWRMVLHHASPSPPDEDAGRTRH